MSGISTERTSPRCHGTDRRCQPGSGARHRPRNRLYRGAAVLHTKDKETGAIVVRVREAEHVVDQIPCIGVVFELEVPVDAFATATYQTANDLREGLVSDHGCRLRLPLAVTESLAQLIRRLDRPRFPEQ